MKTIFLSSMEEKAVLRLKKISGYQLKAVDGKLVHQRFIILKKIHYTSVY